MPARLRPTAPLAADAILVGDPGRALLLAQELLEQPKMSNHARGLWGYTGRTAAGDELTIQATGMGGPERGAGPRRPGETRREAGGPGRHLRRGGWPQAEPGELLLPTKALAGGGSAASFGVELGEAVEPDAELLERLARAAGSAREVAVASLDTMPSSTRASPAGRRRRHADGRRPRPGAGAGDRGRRDPDRLRGRRRAARRRGTRCRRETSRPGRRGGTLNLKSRVRLLSRRVARRRSSRRSLPISRAAVDFVLDLLEALRERAQAALEPLDLARRGQVERRHRRLLGLLRLLAGAEGGGQAFSSTSLSSSAWASSPIACSLRARRPSWSSSSTLILDTLEAHQPLTRNSS